MLTEKKALRPRLDRRAIGAHDAFEVAHVPP
jgi:hypothetical protein